MGARILILEDDTTLRRQLGRVFTARGCEVVEERSQRVGTSAQEPGVHIAMRAVVDVADEPRLRIGLDFELQAQ